MSNIKVTVLGMDHYINQIPRIKKGFEDMGYIISRI